MTRRLPQTTTQPAPRWGEIAAVVVVAALLLFFRLDARPVDMWDEARVALSALEMMNSANPLVVTLNGEADLWNPKPPFAVWLAALSMQVFGVNELALRIPAAAGATLTVLATYLFTRRVSGSRVASALAAFILLGTGGYYQIHVARSAEYDSLLVLFMALATFRLFFAIEGAGTSDHDPKDFYWAAAFIAAGLFTKSVAGLTMLPGYLLYAIWSGKLRALATCRATWVSAAFVLGAVSLFLAAREVAEPGFARAIWDQDVVNRFGLDLGDNGWGLFYLTGLLWPWQLFWLSPPSGVSTSLSAFPWSVLLPFAGVFGLLSKRPCPAHASAYLAFSLTGFLIVISAADMGGSWYVAPAYPLIAALTAIGINEFRLKMRDSGSSLRRTLGQAALPAGIALGVASVTANLAKTERSLTGAHYPIDAQLPYFLRSFASDHQGYAKIRIVRLNAFETPAVRDGNIVGMEPYDGNVEFYARRLRAKGADVEVVSAGYAVRPNEVLIGCGAEVRAAYRALPLIRQENRCFALGKPSTPTRPLRNPA